MTKTFFDKQIIESIGKDINAALDAIAKKYDISINKGAMSYSLHQMTCKITASPLSEPVVQDSENLVGRKFKSGGNNVYTIVEQNGVALTLQTQRGTRYSATTMGLDKVVWVA